MHPWGIPQKRYRNQHRLWSISQKPGMAKRFEGWPVSGVCWRHAVLNGSVRKSPTTDHATRNVRRDMTQLSVSQRSEVSRRCERDDHQAEPYLIPTSFIEWTVLGNIDSFLYAHSCQFEISTFFFVQNVTLNPSDDLNIELKQTRHFQRPVVTLQSHLYALLPKQQWHDSQSPYSCLQHNFTWLTYSWS